ncbi:hypothetical protein SSKA14_4339 [Stenotrophomonas sp. SKA14]|nr:hypothetical protein SSKA14_4339 [Stenotrophomonas sp. SKA14]
MVVPAAGRQPWNPEQPASGRLYRVGGSAASDGSAGRWPAIMESGAAGQRPALPHRGFCGI